jgi:hypothetical protein
VSAANHEPDHRTDSEAHNDIGEILTHFREFYTTCHLLGQQRISATEAQARTGDLEMKLNQMLARLTAGARGRSNL